MKIRKRRPVSLRLAEVLLWGLVLLPPLVLVPSAKDAFRLPKLLLSEWLALASLPFLALQLRRTDGLEWRRLVRLPALQVVVPILAVASLGLVTTDHPQHVLQALVDLWIAGACLLAWSTVLEAGRLERFLRFLVVPATLLAVLGILQFHDVYRPFVFVGGVEEQRLGLSSLAGGAADLSAYLVLPCLMAQERWARSSGWRRIVWLLAGMVCIYGLVVTQTLGSIVALLAGSLVFWWLVLPRRRLVIAGAAALVALMALSVGIEPLRQRLVDKGRRLAQGDVNSVLSGRLDGWWAALWMLEQHPWSGVGHGAYRAEFAAAKLALAEDGTRFFIWHAPGRAFFSNAHNEFLEAAAEWGLPGLAALIWCLYVLVRSAQCKGSPLAWAGLAGLTVLCLAQFPLRLALVAYPALLFVGWVLVEGEES